MNRFRLLVLLLILPFSFGFAPSNFHPLKMSYTNMKYNEQNKKMELSIRIFEDDLTVAIQNKYNYKAVLGKTLEDKQTKAILSNYFNECVAVKLAGKKYPLSYLGGKENGDFGLVFKLEINQIDLKKAKQIQVSNLLLLNEFKEQTNIFFMEIKSNNFNHKFNTNNPIKLFDL